MKIETDDKFIENWSTCVLSIVVTYFFLLSRYVFSDKLFLQWRKRVFSTKMIMIEKGKRMNFSKEKKVDFWIHNMSIQNMLKYLSINWSLIHNNTFNQTRFWIFKANKLVRMAWSIPFLFDLSINEKSRLACVDFTLLRINQMGTSMIRVNATEGKNWHRHILYGIDHITTEIV